MTPPDAALSSIHPICIGSEGRGGIFLNGNVFTEENPAASRDALSWVQRAGKLEIIPER